MVCGLANVFPDLLKKMYDAYQGGDRHQAMKLQRLVLKVRNLAKSGPTVPILHEILRIRGIDAGYARSPLIEIDDQSREKIRSELKKIKL